MIEQKEYFKENIKTDMLSLKSYESTGLLTEIPYHSIHEYVFNDIKFALNTTIFKCTITNKKIINFLKTIAPLKFDPFTWEYYFYMNHHHHNKSVTNNIIQIKYEYLYFLLYLYELVSNEKKLKLFSHKLNTTELMITPIIKVIKESLDNEINNFQDDFYYCKYYLKYYLQHRKEFNKQW